MRLSLIAASGGYLVAIYFLATFCPTSMEAATITGLVRDLQRTPLEGVHIEITCEQASKRVLQVTSGKDGAYSFAKLPPGRCQLSAEKAGFSALTPVVVVTILKESASITADFTLSVLPHERNATASQPQLKFEASGIRGLIDPGGYSAPADAAAASGLISGVADIRRTENNAGSAGSRDFPCSLEPELTKAVAASPDNADANRRLGEFYLAHGLTDQAILYLRRARQIEVANPQTIYDLSEALVRSGHFDAAREQLSAMPEGAKDVSFHRLSAKAEEGSRHFTKASDEYRLANEKDPSEGNVFGEGYELILAGLPGDATRVFAAGAARYPRSTTLLIGAGTGEFLQGHSSIAVTFFLRATDLNPLDPKPYSFLAEAFVTSREKDAEVLASVKRYWEQSPTSAEAVYFYAVVLEEESADGTVTSRQVEPLLKQAIALDPNFTKAHFQLGTLYAHREDYRSAIREFEETEHLAPAMKEVHYRLALAYRRAGQADAADREMKLFREAREPNKTEGEDVGISVQQFISVVDRPGKSTVNEVQCSQKHQ